MCSGKYVVGCLGAPEQRVPRVYGTSDRPTSSVSPARLACDLLQVQPDRAVTAVTSNTFLHTHDGGVGNSRLLGFCLGKMDCWSCEACTLQNPYSKATCEACGAFQPVPMGIPLEEPVVASPPVPSTPPVQAAPPLAVQAPGTPHASGGATNPAAAATPAPPNVPVAANMSTMDQLVAAGEQLPDGLANRRVEVLYASAENLRALGATHSALTL